MRRVLAGFGRLAMAVLATVPMLAMPAQAAKVVVMTPGTVSAAMAQLRPGDTLRLQGDFTSTLWFRDRDFGGVVVDGRAARLHQGMQVRGAHNITFADLNVGTLGVSTNARFNVNVQDSSHVSFARGTWAGAQGAARTGLRIVNSQFMTVRDSQFDGLLDNILLIGSSDSLLTRNSFTRGGSDGIKLVNNQRVIASANSCTNFSPVPLAHPDCIQLWSVVGQPLQADIYLLNNYLMGNQQGFVSFDPSGATGTRYTFAGNYVVNDRPHAIFCGGCTESRFEDNVVVTLPHATWVSRMTLTNAPDAITNNNMAYDLRGMSGPLEDLLPARQWSDLVPSLAWQVGSRFDERSWHPTLQLAATSTAGSAPEPGTWLMMALGFLAVGRRLRRRPDTPRHVLA